MDLEKRCARTVARAEALLSSRSPCSTEGLSLCGSSDRLSISYQGTTVLEMVRGWVFKYSPGRWESALRKEYDRMYGK